MDKWTRVLASRPDDLSSISKNNMVKKDKQLPQVILSPAYTHTMSHTQKLVIIN